MAPAGASSGGADVPIPRTPAARSGRWPSKPSVRTSLGAMGGAGDRTRPQRGVPGSAEGPGGGSRAEPPRCHVAARPATPGRVAERHGVPAPGWCLRPLPRGSSSPGRGRRSHRARGRRRLHRRGGRCRGDGDAAAEVTLGEGPEVPDGAGTAGAMAEVEAAGSGAGDSPEAGGGSGGGWRRPHGPLQRYYGPPATEAAEAAPDPTDINGPHFDPEAFLTKVTFGPTVTCPPGAPGSGWRPWPEPRGPRAGPPCQAGPAAPLQGPGRRRLRGPEGSSAPPEALRGPRAGPRPRAAPPRRLLGLGTVPRGRVWGPPEQQGDAGQVAPPGGSGWGSRGRLRRAGGTQRAEGGSWEPFPDPRGEPG